MSDSPRNRERQRSHSLHSYSYCGGEGRGGGRHHHHHHHHHHNHHNEYEEYISGRKILLWGDDAINWSSRRLVNYLNGDRSIRHCCRKGEEAVVDAYFVDGSGWIIKVADEDIAALVRERIRNHLGWWVYPDPYYKQRRRSSSCSSSSRLSPNSSQQRSTDHHPLNGNTSLSPKLHVRNSSNAPPRHKKHSPATMTESNKSPSTTIYIRPPTKTTKGWLIGVLKSQMQQKGYGDGDIIDDVVKLHGSYCWSVTAKNPYLATKLLEVFNNYGDWKASWSQLLNHELEYELEDNPLSHENNNRHVQKESYHASDCFQQSQMLQEASAIDGPSATKKIMVVETLKNENVEVTMPRAEEQENETSNSNDMTLTITQNSSNSNNESSRSDMNVEVTPFVMEEIDKAEASNNDEYGTTVIQNSSSGDSIETTVPTDGQEAKDCSKTSKNNDMTIDGLATDNTAVIRNSSIPSDESDANSGECHEYLPGEQDVLWDPQRANEAEQRGEDIEGFLRGDYELVKKQYLMELLHKCNYNVELARSEYTRFLQISGEPSSVLGTDEGREFENLLKSSNRMKNFNELSKEIRRSPADCMIHYYRWKRTTSEEYLPMKMEWKKKTKKKEDEKDHPFAEEDSSPSPSSTWVRRSIRPRRFPTPPPMGDTGMATNSTDTHTGNDGSSAGTTKAKSSELKQAQMQIQETKEQKEKLLKVGDIVYAKYHQNREYYWGRITSSTMIPSKGLRYHVQFHDGDESPSVSATDINRGSKMVESIRNGWWDEYLPPQEYLEELYKEADNDQRKQNAVDCGGGDDGGDAGAVVGKENAITTSNHVSSQTKRAASQDNIEDKSKNLQNPIKRRRRIDANTKKVDKKAFPELLFSLLERADADPTWAQIIGWVDNGTAFEIFDGADFVTIVMPTKFTTCRMDNFCHQLTWYGFDRIGDGKYRHIQFNRNNKDQSIRIPRLKGSPKPFAPGFTNIKMKPEKRKVDHAGSNKKGGHEKGGGEANESAICRPKRRRTSVSVEEELTTVNADKPAVAVEAAAATSNISHKKKPTPLTNQKPPGRNDVSAVAVIHESNSEQEKGDREGQKDCPITLSDDDDDDDNLAGAFTELAAVGIQKEGGHSSPKDNGLPIVVDDGKQLPQPQKASSLPGQASPNEELGRLRIAGRKAALYYIREKDKRKQLQQEHETLKEKERNSQHQLLLHQETVKSAVRDLERLKTENSSTVHGLEEKLRQTVLMYQTREEKTKELIRKWQAHSSATSAKLAAAEGQLLEERAKGAAQAVELAKTENNLNQVHDSWQEQYTQLEDKDAQIEQMKLQLESQQADIGKERALREDSEQRYHNVTRSLALQTSELARERQERRRLEELVASL